MSAALKRIQIIHSLDGEPEYVLLPYPLFQALQRELKQKLGTRATKQDFVPFDLDEYVDNPVALARIQAGLSQSELARRMKVTQAYISKVEAQDKVTPKLLQRVNKALKKQ